MGLGPDVEHTHGSWVASAGIADETLLMHDHIGWWRVSLTGGSRSHGVCCSRAGGCDGEGRPSGWDGECQVLYPLE